jgi:hypothetical protein
VPPAVLASYAGTYVEKDLWGPPPHPIIWSIEFVPNKQGVTNDLLEMHISGKYRYSKVK